MFLVNNPTSALITKSVPAWVSTAEKCLNLNGSKTVIVFLSTETAEIVFY